MTLRATGRTGGALQKGRNGCPAHLGLTRGRVVGKRLAAWPWPSRVQPSARAQRTWADGVKRWRGDYVIVFPRSQWKFHKCVVCGHDLDFGTKASDTGVGPECARKPADLIEQAKREALEGDRRRYRREVIDLGFKIE